MSFSLILARKIALILIDAQRCQLEWLVSPQVGRSGVHSHQWALFLIVWLVVKYPRQVAKKLDLEHRPRKIGWRYIHLGCNAYTNIGCQFELFLSIIAALAIGTHLADYVIPPTVKVRAIGILGIFDNLSRFGRIDSEQLEDMEYLCRELRLDGEKVPTVGTITTDGKVLIRFRCSFSINH